MFTFCQTNSFCLAEKLKAAESATLDIENGPTSSLSIFCLNSEKFVLCFKFHHLFLDGYACIIDFCPFRIFNILIFYSLSCSIFLQQLSQLYLQQPVLLPFTNHLPKARTPDNNCAHHQAIQFWSEYLRPNCIVPEYFKPAPVKSSHSKLGCSNVMRINIVDQHVLKNIDACLARNSCSTQLLVVAISGVLLNYLLSTPGFLF
jgi:hypothetical protein